MQPCTTQLQELKTQVNVNKWAYQWKTSFNSTSFNKLQKQAQEVIPSKKMNKRNLPLLVFDNDNVSKVNS